MYSQNILSYYGSKLDLKLDSSELYDYEIGKNEVDYDTKILDLTTSISYPTLIIDSVCLNNPINVVKPWANEINFDIVVDNCEFNIQRRTEKGWTLDFIFNRNNLDWSNGNIFYYWGISGETESSNYLDNNLSFGFTPDGRIKWESVRYSGYCGTSGFTGTTYITSGQTPVLCSGGTSNDFEITITFERYRQYDDCDLLNQGGSNDLITGWTVTNVFDVITGATEDFIIIEWLNEKWFNERIKRLGILKIYLNGNPIYKIKDWEEIIPSNRNSDNSIVQVWGGGTNNSGDIHDGITNFELIRIEYYEEPLNFLHIKNHYLVDIKPNYNIIECNQECIDDVYNIEIGKILTDDNDYITTSSGEYILYNN